MNKKVSVGIIGFGLSGKSFHAPFIAANHHFILSAIVSSRKKEIQSLYPDVNVLSDENQLFSDPQIDLIIIASPNKYHYNESRTAIESGKHVIVDKPFTTTSEEADDLIKLAKANHKILSVYHNRRWDGDFLTIKKITGKDYLVI